MSVPYSPSLNGVAENQWRTLFEMGKWMLLQATLPKICDHMKSWLLHTLETDATTTGCQ